MDYYYSQNAGESAKIDGRKVDDADPILFDTRWLR